MKKESNESSGHIKIRVGGIERETDFYET